jgi:hypothetical protein
MSKKAQNFAEDFYPKAVLLYLINTLLVLIPLFHGKSFGKTGIDRAPGFINIFE